MQTYRGNEHEAFGLFENKSLLIHYPNEVQATDLEEIKAIYGIPGHPKAYISEDDQSLIHCERDYVGMYFEGSVLYVVYIQYVRIYGCRRGSIRTGDGYIYMYLHFTLKDLVCNCLDWIFAHRSRIACDLREILLKRYGNVRGIDKATYQLTTWKSYRDFDEYQSAFANLLIFLIKKHLTV